MQLQLPHRSRITLSAGYSDPVYRAMNWANGWGITDLNLYEEIENRSLWGTVYFDTEITSNLSLHIAGQYFDNNYMDNNLSLGTGIGGLRGDLIYGKKWQDETSSFAAGLPGQEKGLPPISALNRAEVRCIIRASWGKSLAVQPLQWMIP